MIVPSIESTGERAKSPAAPTKHGQGNSQTALTRRVFGIFELAGEEFALGMEDLLEVISEPESLQPMPLAPPYMLGLHQLRSMVLPVVDLCILLALPKQADTNRRKLAILKKDGYLLGVLFDRVVEVLRVPASAVLPVQFDDSGSASPVQGVVCHDGGQRVIQVLALDQLLRIHNLPHIANQAALETRTMTTRMRDLYRDKLLGFQVGSCKLAVEMRGVVEIMESSRQRASMIRSPISDQMVLRDGRNVPVVKLGNVLGLDSIERAKVVLCRLNDGECDAEIAFEVDSVSSIIPYTRDRVAPIPVLQEHRAQAFHGLFSDASGEDWIVLNDSGLLDRQELRTVIQAYQRTAHSGQATETVAASPKVPVLAFRLGALYGLKLAEVLEVLESAPDLPRTPDTPSAVRGLLNLRGTPVPVVDPRKLFRLDNESVSADQIQGKQDPGAPRKILVFQDGERRVGMLVDSVESILSLPIDDSERLPDLLFQPDRERFQEGFAGAKQFIDPQGKSTAIILLRAEQIVGRLVAALQRN